MCLRLSANRVTSKRNKVVNVSSGVSLEESSLSRHKGEENFSYGEVSEWGMKGQSEEGSDLQRLPAFPSQQLAEQKDIWFYESKL